jgi:hypothetical protein
MVMWLGRLSDEEGNVMADPMLKRAPGADPATGGNPYECSACLAIGVACEFHAGWAEGWDACTAFVARVVEDERASELMGDLRGVEGVR